MNKIPDFSQFSRNGDDSWHDRDNEQTLNDYYGSKYYRST